MSGSIFGDSNFNVQVSVLVIVLIKFRKTLLQHKNPYYTKLVALTLTLLYHDGRRAWDADL